MNYLSKDKATPCYNKLYTWRDPKLKTSVEPGRSYNNSTALSNFSRSKSTFL